MKSLKVWLALALVFVAGVAAGVVGTRIAVRKAVRAAMVRPEMVQERVGRDLDRRLRLDPRQRAEVRRILMRSQDQIRELRREFQPQLRSILEQSRRDIAGVLDSEQQKRFENYLAEWPLPLASQGRGRALDGAGRTPR